MSSPTSDRIGQLQDKVRDRLTDDEYNEISLYLQEEEWELALTLIGDFLGERDQTLTETEWQIFRDLSSTMNLHDRDYSFLKPDPNAR